MIFSLRSMALLLAALSALSTPAATNLIGDVISGSYFFPDLGSSPTSDFAYDPNPFTVDATKLETTLELGEDLGSFIDVDFAASSLTFTSLDLFFSRQLRSMVPSSRSFPATRSGP
jgi:hypothetical protein